jgi:hypothetical protein
VTVLIRFRERAGHVWLEVDYDGLEPPVALFDDLGMIGWSPPVPAPPPASAVDWDRPDTSQGTTYSLRPFRVTGARVDGPRGSGRSGAWTVGERPAYLRTLEGVLRRHASAVAALLPADAELLPEPLSAPPAEEGATTPSVATVSVLVPLAAAPSARGRLEGEGLAVTVEPAVLVIQGSYRGNTYLDEVPGQRLTVAVEELRLESVIALVVAVTGVKRDDTERLVIRRPAALGDPGLRLVS